MLLDLTRRRSAGADVDTDGARAGRNPRVRQAGASVRRLLMPVAELRAWLTVRRERTAEVNALHRALRQLDPSETIPGDDERPVFVLGTGWRTGSTLLQRILVTDPHLLVWGEPMGRMGLVPRLARMLCCIDEEWPPARYWLDQSDHYDLSQAPIANLFPPGQHLRLGLRTMILRWLAEPARKLGYCRWGVKEVRFGPGEAVLLKWLFPQAVFLVITRHPCEAYRSATGFGPAWRFYSGWPDGLVADAASFAAHWNWLATSWGADDLPIAALPVRYEDLTTESYDFSVIEDHVGASLDARKALGTKVRSTSKRGHLAWHEKAIIRRVASRGMRLWGYDRA